VRPPPAYDPIVGIRGIDVEDRTRMGTLFGEGNAMLSGLVTVSLVEGWWMTEGSVIRKSGQQLALIRRLLSSRLADL